jgi:hypothetical protein
MVSTIPKATVQYLTGKTFFPNAISPPFMAALKDAFIVGAIMCFAAAVCSALRGSKYVNDQSISKAKQ